MAVGAHHGTISISDPVALPLPASSRVIGPSACDDGIGSVYRKWPGQPFYEHSVGQSRGQQSDWPTSVLFPLLITAKVCRRYWALSCRFSHWTAGLVSGIENMDVVQKLSGGAKLRFRPPAAPVVHLWLRCTECELVDSVHMHQRATNALDWDLGAGKNHLIAKLLT